MKRIILILLVVMPFLAHSQKKIDARHGKGNKIVSKGKNQTEDRNAEIAKDEALSWERSKKIQNKKTRKRMDKNRKKARKVAVRRANRNKGTGKFLGIF